MKRTKQAIPKLALDQTTIRALSTHQLVQVAGGGDPGVKTSGHATCTTR